MYSSTTEGISAGANAWRSISLCIGIRTGSDMSARRALTRPGGLRPRGPPTPSLAGPHDPRSAPAGAPVARLARYAARPQRVQNSRCEPHNGLSESQDLVDSGRQPVPFGPFFVEPLPAGAGEAAPARAPVVHRHLPFRGKPPQLLHAVQRRV